MEKVAEPQPISVRTSYGKGLISQFSKTPGDIVCGRFWELKWGFGCPLDCAYCYLRGTSWGNMTPRFPKVEYVLSALDEVFNDSTFNEGRTAIFNSGELADSLMNPSLMEKIVDKFETQSKHQVLTLSKFGPKNVEFLVRKFRKQTICAWSINPPEVARRWERAAAQPEKRIEAAKLVYDAGYEVRLRIDPIFPVRDWRKYYEDLVYSIFASLEPGRIIIGTPRGLRKTLIFARKANVDMSWTEFFAPGDTGWGMKLPAELRREIYRFMYDKLDQIGFDKLSVTMCKETTQMWDSLNLSFQPLTCQCYSRQ